MDSYSYGGEKLNIKTRKPYTITKQRERWTDDEHNSFLEALKLYGRAWQQIEEHIGTKTAVQIRSHAQKFFTKLEKEALAKGIPTKQALDIEIPPPRPKRKPNYPYPRKTDPQDGKQQATLVSSLQLIDIETKPLPETSSHQEKLEETSDQGEVPLQENENQGVFMPSLEEEMNNHNVSYITTTETRKYQDDTSNTSSLFDKLSQQPGVHNNYPRHVPVQVVDAKNSVPTFHESSSSSLNKSGVVDKNPLISSSSSSCHQIVANIHPLLNPFCCDNQSSFLHMPSTISSLIVSSLAQNPAAHAAASFAATLWHPPQNAKASSRDHVNPPPSMAAIAGATVAAATAWWAAHGLLPVCTPFYNPASTSTCPFSFGNGNQTRVDDTSNERDKAPSEQHLSSSSSSKEEEENTPEEMVPPVAVVETTTTTTNVRKQVDRSSCGSNTTSSSEIEANALDKHVKEKEETKGSEDVNDSSSCGRTSRSSIISPNESWKEVSEEGRLAFQALFSREVLPQSFCDTRRRDIPDNNQLDLNEAAAVGESNGFAHLPQAVGLPSVKLNFHHTGFKPYKRCSIDAKETTNRIAAAYSSTGNQNGDHEAPKRMRLETST